MLQGRRITPVLKNGRATINAYIRLNSTDATPAPKAKVETPTKIASSSALPHMPNLEAPVRDAAPKRRLDKAKIEKQDYVPSQWRMAFGEAFIGLFRTDMDKIRGASIGGSKYYYMCKEQALQYKDEPLSETASYWYETLGLSKSFAIWFQITSLHVWMLFVRMRAMPFAVGKNYQQHLIDRLFKDMELRLSEEMNVLSGRISDTYLKDFHQQFLGLVFSYDEAIASEKPDAVLAAALWRNIFNGDKNVDMVKLESVVRYVRMQLYVLEQISDRAFGFGDFQFISPTSSVKTLTPAEIEQMRLIVKNKYEPEGVKLVPSQRSKLSIDE